MKSITIAGQIIEVRPLNKSEQGGLWLELIANFEMGKFEFNGCMMLLFTPNHGINYTPLQLKKISERIESVKQMPVVFCYDRLLTYERDRLVEQGVYFIVAEKYAFVPTLIINRRENTKEIKRMFSPSVQYLLLYHLQIAPISGKSIRELENIIPYKYKTIAKSVNQLQYLGLLKLEGSKEKSILLEHSPKKLWDMAQSHLVNPIKAAWYSSTPLEKGRIAGISALSHYSMLAPEDVPTKSLTTTQFKELEYEGYIFLPFEDVQRIEVWKYPPLGDNGYVDRLSLYLTLKDEADPRVKKELETMINGMPW